MTANPGYNRPDFKPYPAMIKQSEDTIVQDDQLWESTYMKYKRKKRAEEDTKRSPWYRLFWPNSADWTVK